MLRTRRRNKITRPGGRPHAQTVGGLNAETRGGIEPMGKIFLLTFLFIGLPDRRQSFRNRKDGCANGWRSESELVIHTVIGDNQGLVWPIERWALVPHAGFTDN
jgi:hypothetical protein